MNTEALAKNAIPIALGVSVLLGVVYFLTRKTVTDAAAAVANVNKDTAYEGAGLIGTLGHATDAVSGGLLSAAGEKIASWFAPQVKGADIHYAVTFPDGSRHAIYSGDIGSQGFFTYNGRRYRVGYNQAGLRVAVQQ